jgi:hypothetical protein
LEYLKASFDDLITLLSSSVQNSEGSDDGGDSCADPCQEFKQGSLGVSFFKCLVAGCHSFCLFFIFYNIHTFSCLVNVKQSTRVSVPCALELNG